MAGKRSILAIGIEADAGDAAAEFDKVGAAATAMGDKLDRASKTADDAGDRMGRAAEGADGLASKSSQATGGLGALASGLELVGLDQYAVGLQSAAMATDFFSGVGDIANLVLESQAVATIKNTALKAKDIVVTTAQTVATQASAAAQWALNAAMSANPIGLVVIALIALVAIFVVAYKKSETFRNIVNGALNKVRDVASAVFGWFKDHWKLLLAILTGPFGLAVAVIVKNWDKIKGAATAALDFLKRVVSAAFSAIRDTVTKGVGNAVDAVRGIPAKLLNLGGAFARAGQQLLGKVFDGLGNIGSKAADIGRGIIDGIIGAINTGIAWINEKLPNEIDVPGPFDIDLPDNPIPSIPGLGGSSSKVAGLTAGGGALFGGAAPGSGGFGETKVTVNVYGAVDAYQSARQIDELLSRRSGWRGQLTVVGTP